MQLHKHCFFAVLIRFLLYNALLLGVTGYEIKI